MKLIIQKSLRSGTRNLGNGKIAAEAVLLSTDTEMTARLVAAQDTFLIEQADWESLRSGSLYAPCAGTAQPLIGAEAFFGISPALARAFPEETQATLRSLFGECIKAMIQSECYLYPLRGFADREAYQAHWDVSHPNSCRYYSHLDRVSRRWFGYIGEASRSRSLFHRHKSVAVWQTGPGQLHASGSFIDSFHELGIQAGCSADGRINALSGSFLRAPDCICFSTTDSLAPLIGKSVLEINRKDLNRAIGGTEGCAHLLDLVQEIYAGLQEALKSFDSSAE